MKGKEESQPQIQVCTICLEQNANATSRTTQCSLDCCHHRFCLPCIRRWSKVSIFIIQRNNTCPLCRSTYSMLKTHHKIIRVIESKRPFLRRRGNSIQNNPRPDQTAAMISERVQLFPMLLTQPVYLIPVMLVPMQVLVYPLSFNLPQNPQELLPSNSF